MQRRKRVLVVCPTAWDARQLAALPAAAAERYEVVLDELADDDVRWDLDVDELVADRARRWRGGLDGVFSSSDYPGAVAAALLARELGLPGPSPASVLAAGNKHASRRAQRVAIPHAVPGFHAFDPDDEGAWPDAFPAFVKPVRGSYSVFARRVDDRAMLAALARSPALAEFRAYQLRPYERLVGRHAPALPSARDLLAEELLCGEQVTVEGWVQDGRAHVLGVVDTAFHPGTRSFASFDLPSRHPAEVRARMGRIACEVALALGLDHTLFNVELLHEPATDRTRVVELNPRLCGQFGDLHHKVHGTSGYALALALACGERPAEMPRASGAFAAAASVPLRAFEPVRVRRAPTEAELAAAVLPFAGTLAWSDCRPGDVLTPAPEVEDGASVRYAVVNLGGASREDVAARLARLRPALGFELEPLAPAPRARPA